MKGKNLTTLSLFLLCFVAGAALGWFPLVDTDLGHHIATGRYILQHGTIPDTDVLSWTANGKPWLLHQWIPDVFFAAVDARTGIQGLVGLQALLLGLISCALYFSSRKRTCDALISASFAVIGVCIMQQRMTLRPFVFGCLLLAFLDGFLSKLENEESASDRIGSFLSIIAWAALHPFFVIGLARWGQHLFIQILRGKRKGVETILFMGAVSSGLAVTHFLSPYGLENLKSILASGRNNYFATMIVELQPYYSLYPVEALHVLLALLLAAGFILSSDKLVIKMARYVMVLALLAGAMIKARLFPEFTVIAIPLAASGFQQIYERSKPYLNIRGSSFLRLGILFLCSISVISTFMGSPLIFGATRAENLYPQNARQYLAANPPKHVYNDLIFGGFLLWDLYGKVPTFIDGRLEVFGPEFVRDPYRRIFSAGPGWSETLDRWKVDAILLSSERAGNLHAALARSPKWHADYSDEFAIIYRRNEELK